MGIKIHKSLCPVKEKKKNGNNSKILDTDWVLDGFEKLFYMLILYYNSIVVLEKSPLWF